jgi:hypothetical protein
LNLLRGLELHPSSWFQFHQWKDCYTILLSITNYKGKGKDSLAAAPKISWIMTTKPTKKKQSRFLSTYSINNLLSNEAVTVRSCEPIHIQGINRLYIVKMTDNYQQLREYFLKNVAWSIIFVSSQRTFLFNINIIFYDNCFTMCMYTDMYVM